MSAAGEASSPRFAYLGTSAFAATVLDGLVERGLRPALVVTPPDRPRGRGRRLAPPPAAARALELGLALHQAADVNDPDSRARLAASDAEVGLVCAFGQLIRAELLGELELLNVHPSLLPRWRGAAPIERAIMAGDERTGVAIIRIVAELDAGPVALSEPVPIEPGETFGTLEPRLAALGGELAARALRAWAAGELELRPQEGEPTYAEKIAPAERRLDPARPAAELERRVRALTPHVGTYLVLAGGERLGVTEAVARDEPATGLERRGDELLLGCAEGALAIARVKPAGGREMAVGDYLRGHPEPRLG